MAYRAAGSLPIGLHYGAPRGQLVLFATASSGRIDSSLDAGATWLTRAAFASALFDIAFSPDLNRAVACASVSAANQYTEDGETFAAGVQPAGIQWRRIAYGGPVGDRRFVMLNNASTVANKFAWSATGIGAWTLVNGAGAAALQSGDVYWDEDRQLWVYIGFTIADFVCQTSPTGDVWSQSFAVAAGGGTSRVYTQPGATPQRVFMAHQAGSPFYSDALALDAWTQILDVFNGEKPAGAASESLCVISGPGGNPVYTSPQGNSGTWTNRTAPFFPGSTDGLYIPELDQFLWMSSGFGPGVSGLFMSANPANGAVSWTQVEPSDNWDGSLCAAVFR